MKWDGALLLSQQVSVNKQNKHRLLFAKYQYSMDPGNNLKRKVAADGGSAVEKKVKKSEEIDQIVKVELRFFTPATNDSDFDECNGVYIDAGDTEGGETFKFENMGWEGDYGCTRKGYARILLGDRKIGSIYYTLINRDDLSYPAGISFWEACDAESAELEQIASKFFKLDGSLKKDLSKHLKDCADSTGMAHLGVFMYITKIELEAPYDRTASEENVYVGAQAISKLLNACAMNNENLTTTLAM